MVKDNDFDMAAELTTNKQKRAHILSHLGLVISHLGILSKALEYHTRSIGIFDQINDKGGMVTDYSHAGNVVRYMGRL